MGNGRGVVQPIVNDNPTKNRAKLHTVHDREHFEQTSQCEEGCMKNAAATTRYESSLPSATDDTSVAISRESTLRWNCTREYTNRYTPLPSAHVSRFGIVAIMLVIMSCICLQPACALRILLTNDDGIGRQGTQALRTALIDAGHEVHVYAPNTDRTGVAASVQLSVAFSIYDEGVNQTIIDGSPATCVIAGLSFMRKNMYDDDEEAEIIGAPDLILVGISDGFATGPQTLHSSSVGAALVAMGRNIPTMTVGGILPTSEYIDAYFVNVADFAVRLMEAWVEELPLDTMPVGYGLKVSYPSAEEIAGVRVATNGDVAPISLGYVPSEDDPSIYQIAPVVRPEGAPLYSDEPNSENQLIEDGYISVLPISRQWYLPETEYNVRYILRLQNLVRTLKIGQDKRPKEDRL